MACDALVLAAEVGQQAGEPVDPDVVPVGSHARRSMSIRSSGVNSRLLDGVDPDGDDDLVEELGGPADDVEVTVGDRVERPGADGSAHGLLLGWVSRRGRGVAGGRRDRTKAWSRRSAARGRR